MSFSAPAALNGGDSCVLNGANDGTEHILIPQGTSPNLNMFELNPSTPITSPTGSWVYTNKTIGMGYTAHNTPPWTYTDQTTKFTNGGAGNYVTMFGANGDYVYLASGHQIQHGPI